MSNTRLRAADLADEFRSISSDKRMEYVPVRANHLLIAADMLDANDELLMRLNAEYRFRQNIAAENAKLREQLESIVGRSFRTADKMACLDAENAKLRELVRTFYHCTTSGECDECPINGGGPVHLMPDTICDTIHARMCELGVDS